MDKFVEIPESIETIDKPQGLWNKTSQVGTGFVA
jgi:hypothetical protein